MRSLSNRKEASRRLRSHFGAESIDGNDLNTIEEDLWNETDASAYEGESAVAYQAAILEQYKLYVEMADRVSARRGISNTFFLSLNSAVFVLIGVFWEIRPKGPEWVLIFPILVLVAQCLSWFWIIRSYRQLSTAKFAIIGRLERRLPASPYWSAEWVALGRGQKPARYWPLTHVEAAVPALFALAYLGAFVVILLS